MDPKGKITFAAGFPMRQRPGVQAFTPWTKPDRWLTRDEAAAYLQVDRRTVDRYVRDRLLTAYRGPVPGSLRGTRVLRSDVERFAGNHQEG